MLNAEQGFGQSLIILKTAKLRLKTECVLSLVL